MAFQQRHYYAMLLDVARYMLVTPLSLLIWRYATCARLPAAAAEFSCASAMLPPPACAAAFHAGASLLLPLRYALFMLRAIIVYTASEERHAPHAAIRAAICLKDMRWHTPGRRKERHTLYKIRRAARASARATPAPRHHAIRDAVSLLLLCWSLCVDGARKVILRNARQCATRI